MGSIGPFSTTGEGHLPFLAGEPVQHMEVRLITASPAQTRFVGSMSPRGVWHVGQAGLGAFIGDTSGRNPSIISFTRFLHAEYEDWWVPAQSSGVFFAWSMWWRWLPGVQAEIAVFW